MIRIGKYIFRLRYKFYKILRTSNISFLIAQVKNSLNAAVVCFGVFLDGSLLIFAGFSQKIG